MWLRYIALVLISAVLIGCGAVEPGGSAGSDPGATPSDGAGASMPDEVWRAIAGTITRVEDRVLVEEQPGQENAGSKIWFSLSDATEIVVQDGDQQRPASKDDLAVGQQVEVWASGPILESYPGQGGAARIVIIGQAAPSEGATTGELPDRDPDIVARITRIDEDGWLVEEHPGTEIGNKIVFQITDATQIFRRDNGALVPIEGEALAMGETVQAWADGAMALSYPAQGSAAVIIADDTIKMPTPPATLDALPTRPPEIEGEITKIEDRVLIEQQPGSDIGNKIGFSLSDDPRVYRRTGDELQQLSVEDLQVGQQVQAWATGGMVATSFPGQAGAEVIVITEADDAATPEAITLPDRDPDVGGPVSQASNTIWIDQQFILFVTPDTQFARRDGDALEPIDASAITEGVQVEAWVDKISYDGSPPRGNAILIVVTED
jgi:hypothetical protein